ncbi:alpha/beta fold hydrolase [Emticicia sp. W12TSBA100-4]|uniref:RBBP9/YdeN family alpha/beta hydrolase n=1 Tax=Emticicia sp. W12TSBA100-4 TaxID=3160965 RepID=UPI003306895B
MTTYFIIPGLGNSDENHWQTHFENSGENFIRINQKSWDEPDCEDWIQNIEKAVSDYEPSNVVLIAHSMGCTAVAQWAKRFPKTIKGALLVAPSDIENPVYTFPMTGFTPIPLEKLPFKSIVVASSNDIWVSEERAKFFADAWGSEYLNIGEAGHINVAGGYGEWPAGLELLKSFDA